MTLTSIDYMSALLQAQRAVGEKISASVKDVLDECVRAACALVQADCAVIYTIRAVPLQVGSRIRREYDTETISAYPPEVVGSASVPGSTGGIVRWVLRSEGDVRVVEDVRTSPRLPNGIILSQSSFIKEQHIAAFVGLRMGTLEDTPPESEDTPEKALAVLFVNWRTPHNVTRGEEDTLRLFAAYAHIALTDARRLQHIHLIKRESKAFERLFSTLYQQNGDEIDLERTIEDTLRQAKSETGSPYIFLTLKEPLGYWVKYMLTGALGVEREERIVDEIVRRTLLDAEKDVSEVEEASGLRWLGVPVIVAGNRQAALCIEADSSESRRLNQRATLLRLARQWSVVLQQHDYPRALIELREIAKELSGNFELKALLESVVRRAARAMRSVDVITLYYVRSDKAKARPHLGYQLGVRAAENQRSDHVDEMVLYLYHSGVEQHCTGRGDDRHLVENDFCRHEGIRASAGFPLKNGGARFGCMFFNYRMEHVFHDEEMNLLRLFAERAAIAIQSAESFRVLQRERESLDREQRRLKTVNKIAQAISRERQPDQVFRAILSGVKDEVPQADNLCIVERDPETHDLLISPVNLEFYHVDQPPPEGQPLRVSTASGRQGIAGLAITEQKTKRYNDVEKAAGSYIGVIGSTNAQIAVPIKDVAGIQAALVLESNRRNAFNREDEKLLEMVANHAAIAIRTAAEYYAQQQREAQQWRMDFGVLAAGLVHDLTPFVGSLGMVMQDLRERYPDTQGDLENLERMAARVRTVSARLETFITERGFVPQPVAINVLLHRALDLARPFQRDTIKVELKGDCLESEIDVDEWWIAMVLKNLLTNAYTAIPSEREGHVVIRALSQQPYVLIYVEDNGCGIERERWEQIFELGDTNQKHGIHGIGLYYSRELAKKHHGWLQVAESTPGQGACLLLRLPQKLRE